MAELRPHIARIRELGGELVVVGSGSPFFAQGFRELLELPADLPIVSDEKLVSYRAAHLRRGIMTVLDPRSAKNAVRAFAGGFRQGKKQGDETQQGGVMVVARDGEIVYRHESRFVGDHEPVEQVVAALASCTTPRG